ncbi:uncharacterized protein LOC134250398 [Saccostrea cucullata]|uniref:uncharacterized protein LOC134250398 n=1 Tax=Saccostrea cuccullata TaxID=36930 RepID=UPI002ED3B2CA
MAPTTDASTQSVENALRCIFCDSVNTVDACVEERLCAPGQYCYLDKYSVFVRDAEGREKEVIKYNAGCRSSSICHYAQCLHEAILAERNHSIGTREIMGAAHCTQCCTTDRCNLNLCDCNYDF